MIGYWFCIQYWPKSKNSSNGLYRHTLLRVEPTSLMRSLSRKTADQRSILKHARAAAEHTVCVTCMYLIQHQASKPFITSMSPNTGGSAPFTQNTAKTLLHPLHQSQHWRLAKKQSSREGKQKVSNSEMSESTSSNQSWGV